MKKLLSVLLILAFLMPLFANGAKEQVATKASAVSAPEETAKIVGSPFSNNVKITLMNSKPEITEALTEGAAIFGKKYNVSIEIYETSSPGNTLAQKYAAGDAPTVGIMDLANVKDIYAEKLLDLSAEPWANVGGKELGAVLDNKLYAMPFTIEATCVLYNKTAIEKIIGRKFVAQEYATLDAFKSLCAELKKGGMQYPIVLNKEDWSVAHKTYQWIYAYQDGTIAGAKNFLKAVHDGKTTFEANSTFQAVMDTFDFFIANNINHADPLAADYDLNASYVAEGQAAFWLNGTWAWPDFAPFASANMEYGIMGYPINGNKSVEGKAFGSATKFVAIDKVNSSADQQKAAKMFLNWLVYTNEGQDCLVTKCGIVPAFSNITLPPTNPFNVSLKKMINDGMLAEGVSYMPSDHRSVLSAPLLSYIVGKSTRADIAKLLDAYWTERLPK